MTNPEAVLTRRKFLVGGATTAGVIGASGRVSGQDVSFGGWLSETSNFDGSLVDRTSRDEVMVMVGTEGNTGNFAFAPPAVQIDPGTTVVWEWTGEGGGHNVHAMEGADFRADITSDPGVHFDHTFDEAGIVKYQCDPHATLGMKAVIVVGDALPDADGGSTGTTPAGGAAESRPPAGAGRQQSRPLLVVLTGIGAIGALVFVIAALVYLAIASIGDRSHSSPAVGDDEDT